MIYSGGSQSRSSTPPKKIPFDIGGILGRGGMGEVRIAYDERLGRDVALKTVAPGDPQSAARLAREARLTARLEHPGIMPVYEAGHGEDGRPWYAMRLFAGRTLAQAISETPHPSDRIRLVRHVLDTAQTVAYAHEQGILHRDLKPSNILTGAFGETIVADWGLACTAEEAGSEPVGTEGYMSPEQAAGGPLDGRTDVYGLGAILSEVLTGKPPGQGDAVPGLPPELLAIAERALQKEVAQRYPTARAFADDLLAWFEGRRVGAHEYTPRELLYRLISAWRLPILVGAVGLLAVALAAGIGWSSTLEERERAELSEAAAARARASEQRAFAAALRIQAVNASADGLMMEAELMAAHALRRDDTAAARGALAAVYGRPRWSRRNHLPAPECQRRLLSEDGAKAVCFSPNGVTVLSVERGTVLAQAQGNWYRGTFAGDDRHLVLFDSDYAIYTWDLEKEPVQVLGRVARWGAVSRSPRPGEQAIQGMLIEYRVNVPRAESQENPLCVKPAVMQAVALDHQGAFLSACTDHRLLRALPGEVPQVLAELPPSTGMPSLLQALPDGRILVGTVSGHVLLLDPDGHLRLQRHLGKEVIIFAAIQGERAAVGTANDVYIWDLRADTMQMHFREAAVDAAWLPDGDLRIFGKAFEDRIAPSVSYPHRILLDAGVSALGFSPDGRWLVAAGGDGVALLMEPRSGEVVRRLQINDSVIKDLAFSPDSKMLALASAGQVQQVFSVPEGKVLKQVEGVAIRRAVWLQQAGLLLAPYARELLRLPSNLEGNPSVIPNQGMQDMESNLEGTRAVGLNDQGVWVGEDGPEPRWHLLLSISDSTGSAIAGSEVFVSTNKEVLRFSEPDRLSWKAEIPGGTSDIAVSPDGRWLAVGAMDGNILVFSVGEKEPRARMNAHHARVSSLAFSSDSQWLASGSWDNEVRLWSVAAFEADAEVTMATVEAAWGRKLEDILDRL